MWKLILTKVITFGLIFFMIAGSGYYVVQKVVSNIYPKLLMLNMSNVEPYTITCTETLSRVCDVRLSSVIVGNEKYRKLNDILIQANARNTVRFRLAGNGGRISTLIQLMNSIKETKAKTIMIVEGDVYSAHAMLALSGDQIIIKENVMFLFHHSSALNTDACDQYDKDSKDRGISMQQKCRNFVKNHLTIFQKYLINSLQHVLTKQEMKDMLEGHDIIIPGDELRDRLQRLGVYGR